MHDIFFSSFFGRCNFLRSSPIGRYIVAGMQSSFAAVEEVRSIFPYDAGDTERVREQSIRSQRIQFFLCVLR